MEPADVLTASQSPGRWSRRFPRLTAALVSVVAGSAVAAFMAALFLSLGNPFSHVLGFFMFLEITMVLPTSMWAFALFGPCTRRRDSGPLRAMVAGTACVMLAMPTFVAYDAIVRYSRNADRSFILGILYPVVFGLSMYMLTSLLMVFIPQWAGAFGGFLVWRLTKDE